jgi:hypothetical protein
MFLLGEEFDMIGEDELALLTRRFERMHENWVNSRRNTRTCFQCDKPGHFVAVYPEKVENSDNYKHKSKTDGKYRSRRDPRASTRASTRTSDDRGRRRAEARLERWLERATSTPVLRTPPRARVAMKMKVISAIAGSHPRT